MAKIWIPTVHQEYERMGRITQGKIINLFGMVIKRKFDRFIKKKELLSGELIFCAPSEKS